MSKTTTATGARETTEDSRAVHDSGGRDFRLLWAGESASALGSSVTAVALPLVAVVALHAGALAAGFLTAAVRLPWLVVGLPAGAWLDRLRRRPVMVACDVVCAVAYVSVPVAAWAGGLTYAHLLAVALVCGTAAVFFDTAYHAYLPALLSPAQLQAGNARLRGSEAAARVGGRGLAGVLAQASGAVSGLLFDAVTFVVSAVCLGLVRTREPAPRPPAGAGRLRDGIAEGLRFTARDPWLRSIVAYGALVNFALLGSQAVQVVFLVRTLGAGAGTVGVLAMAGSLGGVAGAALAGPAGRRLGTARGMVLIQLAALPFGLLMPLATPGAGLWLFAVGTFTVSAAIVACNVVLGSFRQRYCPPALLGRVVATTMVVNHSTIPLGAVAAGVLGAVADPRTAMLTMAALLATSGAVLLVGPLRTTRDLPLAPPLTVNQ